MVIYFLITCFSFFLFSKSLSLKSLSTWSTKARSFTFWIIKNLSCQLIQTKTSYNQTPINSKSGEINEEMSILDLPELVLESILEKLPPSGLFNMAAVCSSLREKCVSDYLWEKHLTQKWGKFLGPAFDRQWKLYIASRNDIDNDKYGMVSRTLSFVLRLFRVRPRRTTTDCGVKVSAFSLADSNMNRYLALETGKFWFPAQVYNRENGHLGFMLSCYDAEVSYDSHTNTFQARYPPHGRRVIPIEQNVSWERLRAPAIDAPPHDLYVSECLNDLKPGDHIEIQWKRKKEFPYGWWYGVVGHLESCDGMENHCYCHQSDTVVLEFNQYTPGSRWRCTTVNRKDHREEEGNESYGLYGGIRKLKSKEEIATWTQLWPNSTLE